MSAFGEAAILTIQIRGSVRVRVFSRLRARLRSGQWIGLVMVYGKKMGFGFDACSVWVRARAP